jgi:uncharacterized protein YecE (DUF72 family)
LRDIDTAMANFFASGLFELRDKLGPILWQFPPSMRFDREHFERFLDMLPRDLEQARKLALRRDYHVKGRARLAIDRNRRMRHAVEIRHESFRDAAFITMLRRHGVALVVADTAGKWPLLEDVTAGFMYLRLHGDEELYASGYGDAALDDWARRIRAWSRGTQPNGARRVSDAKPPPRKSRDIYGYFDNDAKVRAPPDARALMRRLDIHWPHSG